MGFFHSNLLNNIAVSNEIKNMDTVSEIMEKVSLKVSLCDLALLGKDKN